VKVREVIKQLKDDGWVEVRQESSHRTFRKPGVERNVVVNGVDSKEVAPGVLSKIRRETGLALR